MQEPAGTPRQTPSPTGPGSSAGANHGWLLGFWGEGAEGRGRAQVPRGARRPGHPFPAYTDGGLWAGAVTCPSLSTGEKTKKLCLTLQTHGPHAQPSACDIIIVIPAVGMNTQPWPYQNASDSALLCTCEPLSKAPRCSLWSKPQAPGHRPAWHPAEQPQLWAPSCARNPHCCSASATALGAGDVAPSVHASHDLCSSPSNFL